MRGGRPATGHRRHPGNRSRQRVFGLLPLTLLLCCVLGGCEPANDWEPVFPVRGRLLVDGKPAAGAVICFLREKELSNPHALRSMAEVQADGTFRVTTYLSFDGAPAGAHRVTAYWPGQLPKGASPIDVAPDRLQGRYNDPAHPLARVTITEGENVLEPFEVNREGG